MQLRHWQWLLDTALPGEFGQVGEWLNQGEALVSSDDVPAHLNEEAAAVLNQKIEDHKAFFGDLNSVRQQFAEAVQSSPLVEQVGNLFKFNFATQFNWLFYSGSQSAT